MRMRASVSSVQYASPRAAAPGAPSPAAPRPRPALSSACDRSAGGGGSSTQTTLPVAASSAATTPMPVLDVHQTADHERCVLIVAERRRDVGPADFHFGWSGRLPPDHFEVLHVAGIDLIEGGVACARLVRRVVAPFPDGGGRPHGPIASREKERNDQEGSVHDRRS